MTEREILFRGKRVDNGEWLESKSLMRLDDDAFLARNVDVACRHDENYTQIVEMISVENPFLTRVDTKSIGQYTGLTDKNGTKIFEGDILKGRFYGFPVITDDFVFSVSWHDDVKGFKSNYFEANLCEVIGNIHDNPELLGA